jgi:hypothetical protein
MGGARRKRAARQSGEPFRAGRSAACVGGEPSRAVRLPGERRYLVAQLAGPMGVGRGQADHALLTDQGGFNATDLQYFRCNDPAMCNRTGAKAVRA